MYINIRDPLATHILDYDCARKDAIQIVGRLKRAGGDSIFVAVIRNLGTRDKRKAEGKLRRMEFRSRISKAGLLRLDSWYSTQENI